MPKIVTPLVSTPIHLMTDVAPPQNVGAAPHGDLGRGFNSIAGSFVQIAIDPPQFTEDKIESQNGNMHRVTSHYDFLQMIGLNASANFSGYGVGASAAINFAKSIEITQDSYFVAANLFVSKTRQVLQYPSFTKEAAGLLAGKEYANFLKAFGDQYCTQVIFGGQLILLFRLYAETLNEQQSLDVKLGGSYGPFNAAAELTQKVSTFKSTQTVDIQAWMTGQTAPMQTNPDDVMKFIENFPTTIVDKGYVIERLFLDNTTIVKNLPPHAHVPDLNENKHKLTQLTSLARQFDTYIGRLGYIKQYPFQFDLEKPNDLATIQQKQDTLQEQRDEVDQIANDIIANPVDYNKRLPAFDPAKIALPLPSVLARAHVPLILDVNSLKTYSGTGEDWVGAASSFNWLRVTLPSLSGPNPPIQLQYKVGIFPINVWFLKFTNWIASTTAWVAPVGRMYSIAFQLVGPDADLYDVEYQARLEDGSLTEPGQNAGMVGMPGETKATDGNSMVAGGFLVPGRAMSQLQLRIISKT